MTELPTLDLKQYEPNVKEETGVVDCINGSTRYGRLSGGQCGGRLGSSFYGLGCKKVLAVNTPHHDLYML